MTNLIGLFELSLSNLSRTGFQGTLIIARRKKPTPKKPPLYLLWESKPGNIVYVSSLYLEAQIMAKNGLELYSFDYEGKEMFLELDKEINKAKITPRFTANAINNAVKGVKFTPIIECEMSNL
jgi:hypothetical protein